MFGLNSEGTKLSTDTANQKAAGLSLPFNDVYKVKADAVSDPSLGLTESGTNP